MIGFLTLLEKEFLRFWKVAFQTVAAPVLTALLYLLIFGHVLDEHVTVHGVRYTSFLIPGLVMMQVLQNAFANSSSSLIQAKITGSIVFVLLPPIPYSAFFAAYVLAAVLRGLMVGAGVLLATVWFVELKVVADHAHARQDVRPVADERRALQLPAVQVDAGERLVLLGDELQQRSDVGANLHRDGIRHRAAQ